MARNTYEMPASFQGNDSNREYQWGDPDEDIENISAMNMMKAVDRLEIVKNLREAEDETRDTVPRDDAFLEKHFLEYRESNPSPYGVTLGIEIEIPKESVLPQGSENWKGTEKKKYLQETKEKYKETERLGVPSDTDQFWEFANLPANYPTTLGREVQALIGMGLIDPKFKKFPLHVTIGGITYETKKENDENHTHALARILDATAWETDGERLTAPYHDKVNSNWTSHDATSGVLERTSNKISQPKDGKISSAVEFRTSQFQNLFGLERYLRSAYYLGSALKAFQNLDKDDSNSKELAKIWKRFADQAETIFEEIGLPSPYKIWSLDTENPDEHSPFKTLAKILEKGNSDKESKESKFIHDTRELVIKARAEAKEIIEETRTK